ncbi:Mrp/NBP35 family ATP-binding protein [Halorubrum ezzemoulense]|uniref:Iron-sulfur cluster carrier protein n=2 Tax=Halorubrum ezzemoulense TaxID=337243 RepID=A0A256JN23_HALEZ|nr:MULTISPECIES: Mrp/NBP35 family ATP-binding protein [Halorubrum]MDB2237771.1 Mrp/NBP35 family ATP-binding protein [Halorubrum ezzemoulense]MDB2240631.1 Mrp/NBP35 family ATP-binding protein [Halorubrum ezzemoulense]MDB2243492.1 Mrp/NBP35 family ATP-binding protein [Halorubrum ezzemoulense]MDB2248735.1 Mrp/NBP35 family ATP-binding protein [Halorubrum ezzemoulense]MDB2251558.1 Mrp/NBP35 family ATP-binding protein [Halorubrum ezzemoulense]
MNESDVRERLAEVRDPDLGGDIVSLGLVNGVDVDEADGTVHVSLALGAPFSPTESAIADDVREALADTGLDVELSASIPDDLSTEEQVLPGVQNVIAVASGKGGVGKSTMAVNIAAGLSKLGARVGLFDADVYGPNVPRMVSAEQRPETDGETIVPPERFGVKLMSMDFLTGEDDPVIWRGPMVHKIITQLVEDVEWGELDYLVMDLPPGTGDTQLTILQTLPLTGAVIVTTPQDVALDDAVKGLRMFGKHDTNVLGIAENMAGFRCPDCGGFHEIFGSGGGKALAADHDLPFLGGVPLDPAVRTGGDDGEPVVLEDGETADAFKLLVENVANNAGVVRRRGVSGER